jgi:hypothetical protein
MILGYATSYHSICVNKWILFIVVKTQLHSIGPKFIYLVDNIEAILSTSGLRFFLFVFSPIGATEDR